ncbi:MAG: hypothetical protein ACOYLT_07940 [Flavobacterium sp.]|uniref:hypothetical protein n=1 Tax=Flavobacterium sp. TaxID=239 RepID=UPI003BC50D02
MSYRVPTFQESFPLSHKIDLLNQQSEYFVNKSLSSGGLTEGFKGIPTTIPIMDKLSNEMTKEKIAESLVRNYVKNNWRVMLTCAIVGGTLIYVLYKIDEENQKRNTKK